ncbi:MAG: phage portal protein [Aquihabitans sp.]
MAYRILVPGLSDTEQDTLSELVAQLQEKTPRNLLRAAYYDGKHAHRDLGISTPPQMRRLCAVLGWSAKSVDVLNRRCHLDGFVIPGVESSSVGLDGLWDDNWLALEAPQAGVSSLIHATSFLVATQGGEDEPEVLITAKDAMSGTGRWNRRKRALDAFMSVIDVDKKGIPTEVVLYLPGLNIRMARDKKWSVVDRTEHAYGVPVEALTYRARLGRPFGASRISRAVMSLHDSAVRTVIRSEVTAEIYSVPQRVMLGADASIFQNADGTQGSGWQSVLATIWGIPDDEEAAVPRADIKEFSSAPQDPHVAQLRAWAQLFSGETSIPVTSLGLGGEANPTSAEAYHASREDLISEAEGTTDGWSPAWRRTMLRGLAMLNGWDEDEIPAEVLELQPRWRSPANLSRASAADAAVKTISQFPWLADSELGLEIYGFDDDFIARAMAERRRVGGSAALDAIRQAVEANRPVVTGETDPAQVGMSAREIREKADAMGVLIRAGVSTESAAEQVGLTGVRFTGAVPVSLRLPESDANKLEGQ